MMDGRPKCARSVIGEEPFLPTYGDGVSDADISKVAALHKRKGKVATVTAVPPPSRFGILGMSDSGEEVLHFREKDSRDVGLINGGFFVSEPGVFDLIDDDNTVWDHAPMQRIVDRGKLAAFRRMGFWQPMDTLRDRALLEETYAKGAPMAPIIGV